MNNLENGALKKLKDRLYKEGEAFSDREKQAQIPRRDENITVPSSWQDFKDAPQEKSLMKKIIIFLSVFAILAAASLVYFIFWGGNMISARNIKMEIKGPAYTDAGKVQGLNFYIENKNQSELETANLILEYPEGAVSVAGEPLRRETLDLGTIKPNQSVNKVKDLVFLGVENEEKQIKAVLEYRLADSSAIFTKSENYIVKISKPAVGISISAPKQVNSRQEIEIKVETVSNADNVLKNLSLQMSYPSGFKFIQSDPKPVSGDNTWLIGDTQPLQKREVILRGTIEGQDLDEKAFVASVGVIDENRVFKVYGSATQSLVVKKSPFNFSVFINGQDKEINSARPGEMMNVSLRWNNQMPNSVREARVELEISGRVYDENSISASRGFYNSSEKKIVWNASSADHLGNISSGQSGDVQCGFSIADSLPVSNVNDKDFSIFLKTKISGIADIEGREGMEFTEEAVKEIKVSSELAVQNGIFYKSGPLKNTGPLPPKVGQETTYTVVWSLGNNSSDVSNAKVSASLPSYVRWNGIISPSNGDISYNERDGKVIWNAGFINAGTGTVLPRKEVAFQIVFTPNPSHGGSSPLLVDKGVLEGHNNFTGDNFQGIISELTAMLMNDSGFRPEYGRVED